MLVPGAVCTAPFFMKYKTLALAAGSVCVPLAYIVIPPIVTHIIINYGWRQGYIFLASLCMQVDRYPIMSTNCYIVIC